MSNIFLSLRRCSTVTVGWVCGEQLCMYRQRKICQKVYSCPQNQANLNKIFSIDIRLDELQKHPTQFCYSCKNAIKRSQRRQKSQHQQNPMIGRIMHKETSCLICSPPCIFKTCMEGPKIK